MVRMGTERPRAPAQRHREPNDEIGVQEVERALGRVELGVEHGREVDLHAVSRSLGVPTHEAERIADADRDGPGIDPGRVPVEVADVRADLARIRQKRAEDAAGGERDPLSGRAVRRESGTPCRGAIGRPLRRQGRGERRGQRDQRNQQSSLDHGTKLDGRPCLTKACRRD
jgi:hypothetical protein